MNKLVLSTVLAATLLTPALALPCGNSVYMETDEATQLVAKMERAFKKGQYKRVREMAEDGDIEIEQRYLRTKIMKLVSVAQIRTGAENAGISTLRKLLRTDKDSAYLKTRLAEGLSLNGKTHSEALEILAALEKADLVSDAEGYRTLAILRAAQNDTTGRDAALSRCRLMAKDRKLCELNAPAKQPPAKDADVKA